MSVHADNSCETLVPSVVDRIPHRGFARCFSGVGRKIGRFELRESGVLYHPCRPKQGQLKADEDCCYMEYKAAIQSHERIEQRAVNKNHRAPNQGCKSSPLMITESS